ncbi:MAG: AAA family ATPase [Streptosporangiales bacterium]|nr:AAA family ATPase [Streptosporangiales bacterium]
MWRKGGAAAWVGRVPELECLISAVRALRRGEGSVVWVEGEPGIGKTALVAEALAAVTEPDWEIGWGAADALSERLPLRVMQDCLGVRPGSDDPRRARAAGVLRDDRLGLFADGGTPTAGIEELLALADKLCAQAPLIVVIDDMQWADDASLVAFHQLAVTIGQMPLLLIATCRPAPRRADVRELRVALERRGATMVEVGPLPDADAAKLVTEMLGASPGSALRELTSRAGGNPLYLRELVGALAREQAVTAGPGTTGIPSALPRLPASLTAVLEDRLTAVPEDARQLLRTAALLGGTFSVTDLSVMARRSASALAASLQEAVAAGILAESGPALSFRHPLLRQALYESMPEALRSALHAEGARELAEHGADPLSVAQQLSLSGRAGEGWTRPWLEAAASELTTRAPELAADLLRREVDGAADRAQGGLMASLVQALLAAGSYDEAMRRAGRVLVEITDPVRLAETYSALARAQASGGQGRKAIRTLHQALTRADLPRVQQARMLALLALLERSATGDLEAADAAALQALILAEEPGDSTEDPGGIADDSGDAAGCAHALLGLWVTSSVRRDHSAALDYADRALRVLGHDPAHADLRSLAYDDRIFTLQNLDRWSEAGETLGRAARADRRDRGPASGTWVAAAVYWYWMGQWDDAQAEVDLDDHDGVPRLAYSYLREGWPALMAHGVAALIAGRRDQRTTADRHLRQGLALPVQGLPDRENRDFLCCAHAVALEQNGDIRQAVEVLEKLLHRERGEMTLVHQWMPYLVRLAATVGDLGLARSAARACEAEAEAESQPARAAAASLRSAGILRSDPAPLRESVAHYRERGPAVDLPAALEDLAAVLADKGEEEEARTLLHEAVTLYEGFGAYWDVRRADARLRPFGIRRGTKGPRGPRGPRPESGWEALTPTEVKIAALVGAGQSTSDIASGMFLSRRTVQKHVSNILAKLGVKSRVEIVREALKQGVTA